MGNGEAYASIGSPKIRVVILNKSNLMHNIPFIPGGIDNLSRDSRSISRDVSVYVTRD